MLEQYLDELVKFVNVLPKSYPNRDDQYQALVEKCGITEDLQVVAIFESIESILLVKGDGQKLENLMSQMHQAQLINMDYKFVVTTTDSMIQQNGKCLVNLKLDLLDPQNQRKSVYVELSLNQFYQFYHELKKAHSLMSTI